MDRRLEAAVTKSRVSSSSLSNEIVSSPDRNRAANRSVLHKTVSLRKYIPEVLKTHLATKRSTLSLRDNARWSFSPEVLAPFDVEPFAAQVAFGALCAAASSLCAFLLSTNVPLLIPSKSSGVGGSRERHISDMERRFKMSEWKT